MFGWLRRLAVIDRELMSRIYLGLCSDALQLLLVSFKLDSIDAFNVFAQEYYYLVYNLSSDTFYQTIFS